MQRDRLKSRDCLCGTHRVLRDDLLDDDERWRLLQRCLTDTALPVDVRAAGALTLLFGLPTERIRHLTADQLSCQGKHTYLTAGRRPALLPPRLANLLQELATKPEPQRRLSVHADRRAAQWLFPGLVPGQPIANHALTTRLARHDINVRIARNGALAALAADLPAAVLADLLGMHTTPPSDGSSMSDATGPTT